MQLRCPVRVVMLVSAATAAASGCTSEDDPGTGSTAISTTSTFSGSSTGTGDAGGASSTIDLDCHDYHWGLDWPPADAPPKEPVLLDPLYNYVDCGPGCRQITSRFNAGTPMPYELSFGGSYVVGWSIDEVMSNYADVDTAREYDALANPPSPGLHATTQTLMGEDCIAGKFIFDDGQFRRTYVCEFCMRSQAQRLLATADGPSDGAGTDVAPIASDERYVVLNRAHDIWALDTADGSTHPLTDSTFNVTNVSLAYPYIAIAGPDLDVHLYDVRDWSDTNITADPFGQEQAATDGKTVVWVYDGDEVDPAPKIVIYDLETKQTTQIPVMQTDLTYAHFPAVEGDWVAWEDFSIIRGYNLATKQEYELVGQVPGDDPWLGASVPRFHRGKLYVVGYRAEGPPQLFEFELPEP